MASSSASTWGDPTATKHVFLIHTILGSSQTWHHIAQEFVARGYFVTAPDLLGHGNARRGSDYTIAALAKELRPYFATPRGNDHPYDIVVGYSLGGVVASALIPLLKSTRPVRVVLIDPPFEQTPETVAFHRKLFGDVARNPRTPEACLKEAPQLTEEDATFWSLSTHLCDVAAVEAIHDQNLPWSFSHQLSTVPDNVKVVVLSADPSKAPRHGKRMEDLKPYPHVNAKIVRGASYLLPHEFPMVVVGAALEGTGA